MLIAIAAGTIAIAIISVLALNFSVQKDYSTLFTGLNQEEAIEVVALLQDGGVDYRYNDKNGEIRVSLAAVDQTRAELLSKGYPKSGFTYDIYRDNTGLMTTESDKKQYTLYDLQDRLGAQIRLFDGVRDAKVTIAEADNQKYALADTAQTEASASVVVTMKSGRVLSGNEAAAFKNLIARAVQGMTFTNVAVFDADTMIEVGSSGDDGTYGGIKDFTALTGLVENHIAGNVRRVLEKLYGQGTVAVSVRGTLNMEKLIQENTHYSTPEKIDEQDKTGLKFREDTASENSGSAGSTAGGVVGADANADTPRYTNQDGTEVNTDTYGSSSAVREWLYNSVKEQRQVYPGVLENATIGVVIDTKDLTIPMNDLTDLVANSAGIGKEEATEKITIIRAESPDSKRVQEKVTEPVNQAGTGETGLLPLPIMIAMIAGAALVLFVLIALLIRRKQNKQQLLDDLEMDGELAEDDDFPSVRQAEAGLVAQMPDEELEHQEEMLNIRMQHSLKLKQNIGEFVDQNPQIAAKLVQSWLRGKE
ncbi:MAG: flagellar M-ring protein FliF C-terminal domain-containing protein [Lachnospiraceae bacterium]